LKIFIFASSESVKLAGQDLNFSRTLPNTEMYQ